MTVGATYKINYSGTGAQSVFPYTFRIVAAADLAVYKIDGSGNPKLLTLTTDYTVDGVLYPTGGNVTLVAGNLPVGYTLTIMGDPAIVQATQLVENGTYSAVAVMNALDALTRMLQSTNDMASRSPRVPASESPGDIAFTLPPASYRALMAMGFDVSGNPFLFPIPNGSGTAQPVVSSGGTTTATPGVDVVIVTGTLAHTIVCPACRLGYHFQVINRSTQTVTVNRANADTINGGTTIAVLTGQILMVTGNVSDWAGKAF